jgi:hypothetical protein
VIAVEDADSEDGRTHNALFSKHFLYFIPFLNSQFRTKLISGSFLEGHRLGSKLTWLVLDRVAFIKEEHCRTEISERDASSANWGLMQRRACAFDTFLRGRGHKGGFVKASHVFPLFRQACLKGSAVHDSSVDLDIHRSVSSLLSSQV